MEKEEIHKIIVEELKELGFTWNKKKQCYLRGFNEIYIYVYKKEESCKIEVAEQYGKEKYEEEILLKNLTVMFLRDGTPLRRLIYDCFMSFQNNIAVEVFKIQDDENRNNIQR